MLLDVHMPGTKRKERRGAWLLVGLVSLIILISLPLTPIIWNKALAAMGARLNVVPYTFSLFLIVLFFLYLLRNWNRYGLFRILLFAAVGAIYIFIMKTYCKFPAEKLHMVEYGLLAFVAYRALSIDFSALPAYSLAFALASSFGFVDELIQFILPNRSFEVRDVVTNVLASALGLIVVMLLVAPDACQNSRERP